MILKIRNETLEGINKLKQGLLYWSCWFLPVEVSERKFYHSVSTAHFVWADTAELCSEASVIKEIVKAIFYPRTSCKEQPSYLSGTPRRLANTKISVPLACTWYTHLWSMLFTEGGPSQPLLQGQRENVRTQQMSFRICYVMFSGTVESWHYAEYLYKQQFIGIWGQCAELSFTHCTGCRQRAKPAVWTS